MSPLIQYLVMCISLISVISIAFFLQSYSFGVSCILCTLFSTEVLCMDAFKHMIISVTQMHVSVSLCVD
jgi:hypothetical protein